MGQRVRRRVRARSWPTPLKLAYIPVTHVENACATGSEAIRSACYAVAAGMYDIVLAVGAEKLKDTGYSGLPQTRPVATWSYRLTTQTPAAGFAMMATGYFAKYGLELRGGQEAPRRRSPSRTTTTARSTPRPISSARSPWSRPSTRP